MIYTQKRVVCKLPKYPIFYIIYRSYIIKGANKKRRKKKKEKRQTNSPREKSLCLPVRMEEYTKLKKIKRFSFALFTGFHFSSLFQTFHWTHVL